MNARELARYYAGGRVAIGLLLLLFPGRVLQGMLGGRDAVTPGVHLIGRMLGARDSILGAGTLTAFTSPSPGDGEVRAWLRYSAIADASDAVAMAVAYRHLPAYKRFLMLAFAVAGTATGAYLTTTLTDD